MSEQQIVHIPVDQIEVEAEHNPRTQFEVQAIEELANSIRQRGLLQPLVVREEGGKYFLVAGERRLRACQGGTLDVVPCIVKNGGSAEPAERLTDALVENLQREDISIADEVRAYGRLKEDHGWNAQRIALEVGVPQNRVTKRMQLLALPVEAIDAAAALNEKARKALVAIARSAPTVAGEIAKYLDGQSDEVKVDFGKQPCSRLRGFHCTKDFPLMAQDAQYDAAEFLVTEEAHEARNSLAQRSYGTVWVRVSEQVVAAGEQLGATVDLADGKVILGWDVCCQLVGDYLVRKNDELAEERKEWETRSATDHGTSSSSVVRDERGEVVEDEAEKKAIRSERAKAEVAEKQEAHAYNEALGAAMIGRMGSVDVTAGVARLLSRLVLAEHGQDYVMRGLRYVHPNGKVEPEGRSKVIKYVESTDAKELLENWLNGARKADEILARLVIVLLAAEYADPRATARSNRGGQQPERGYYQAPADSGTVIGEELPKLLKKAVPNSLYEQALERSRALAQRDTFAGYGTGPDGDAPEGVEDELDDPDGLEPDAPVPGEDLDEAVSVQAAATE